MFWLIDSLYNYYMQEYVDWLANDRVYNEILKISITNPNVLGHETKSF